MIHSLSLLSNAAFGQVFSSTTALQTYLNTVVTNTLQDPDVQQNCLGSDWTAIWGPVAYSENTNPNIYPKSSDTKAVVADNTMVLFYSKSQKLFVIAVAGTNSKSGYAMNVEDLNVSTMQDWQTVVSASSANIPSGAAISSGAYIGLQTLLGMTDSKGNTIVSALSAYLNSLNGVSGLTLAVAGHSLGGALCPLVALYLYNMQLSNNNWNVKGLITNIAVWPTAGPTPGEGVFANYVKSIIGQAAGKNLATFSYISKYNNLDVVPHAWQKNQLNMLPPIYNNYNNFDTSCNDFIGVLSIAALLNTVNLTDPQNPVINMYQQVGWTALYDPNKNTIWVQLKGTFNADIDNNIQAQLQNLKKDLVLYPNLQQYAGNFTGVARYIAQMGYQHMGAYNVLFGITEFATDLARIKSGVTPGLEMTDSIIDVTSDILDRYYLMGALEQFPEAANKISLKIEEPEEEALEA